MQTVNNVIDYSHKYEDINDIEVKVSYIIDLFAEEDGEPECRCEIMVYEDEVEIEKFSKILFESNSRGKTGSFAKNLVEYLKGQEVNAYFNKEVYK